MYSFSLTAHWGVERADVCEGALLQSNSSVSTASGMLSVFYRYSEVTSLALGYKATTGAVTSAPHHRSFRPSVQKAELWDQGTDSFRNRITSGEIKGLGGAYLSEIPPWEARLHEVRTKSGMTVHLLCPPQEKNSSEGEKQGVRSWNNR